jgi:hypothetical protein
MYVLLSFLQAYTRPQQIITSLPDIVDDQTVPALIDGLQELLSTNTSLTVPILDALTNLQFVLSRCISERIVLALRPQRMCPPFSLSLS